MYLLIEWPTVANKGIRAVSFASYAIWELVILLFRYQRS
jgi:hypothetical protein